MAKKEQPRHKLISDNWINYTGNKKDIVDQVLDFIPKHIDTFVDLFGGTGFVSASVWLDKKPKKIVLNEFEYDWAKTLAFMAQYPPDEIIEYYEKLQHKWFGDEPRLTLENKAKWIELKDYYNDYTLRFDSTPKQRAKWSQHHKQWEDDLAKGKITKEELTELRRLTKPELILMFLARTSVRSTPRFSDWGRKYNMTPKITGKGGTVFPPAEKMRPFLEVWHDIYKHEALDIYSHNFLDLHMKHYKHQRPRPDNLGRANWLAIDPHTNEPMPQDPYANQGDFNDLLETLDEHCFVYIDPPYFQSGLTYAGWSCANETTLLSLCDTLTANGIPYLMNNNIQYDNKLLRAWMSYRSSRSGADKKFVFVKPKTYLNDKKKKGVEVFVTNFSLPPSRYGKNSDLVEVPHSKKGEDPVDPYDFATEYFKLDEQ